MNMLVEYKKAQLLCRWAIGLSLVGFVSGIGSAVFCFCLLSAGG